MEQQRNRIEMRTPLTLPAKRLSTLPTCTYISRSWAVPPGGVNAAALQEEMTSEGLITLHHIPQRSLVFTGWTVTSEDLRFKEGKQPYKVRGFLPPHFFLCQINEPNNPQVGCRQSSKNTVVGRHASMFSHRRNSVYLFLSQPRIVAKRMNMYVMCNRNKTVGRGM